MAMLVPPVMDRPGLKPGLKFIEHIVLPKRSQVLWPQMELTPEMAEESGIKAIHLRCRDDLRGPMGAIRAHHMSHKGSFQNRQVITDRRSTYLAGSGILGSLEDAATLGN